MVNAEQYSIFFVVSFAASGLTIFLGVSALRQRQDRTAVLFALMMASVTIWNFAIGFGMAAKTESANFVWAVIRMAGVFAVPVLWLGFALQFSDHGNLARPGNLLLLSIEPLLSLLLLSTNNLHHLFLQRIDYIQAGSFLIDKTWVLGPWFWLHFVYSYMLILVGDFYIIRKAIQLVSKFKLQAFILVLGTAFPLISNLMYTFHLIPGLVVNYDPLGFVFSGVAFSFAIFQYQLFDLKPIARQLLIDSMGDGMLVFDDQLRLVDLNPAAKKNFGIVDNDWAGRSMHELLGSYIELDKLLAESKSGHELVINRDRERRVYDLRVSPIMEEGYKAGHLLVLRDVTRYKKLEEELKLMAVTDALTGAYNHRNFFELGKHELVRANRYQYGVAVILFDVDNFKRVNDRFGHLAGDKVLKGISQDCKYLLRNTDIFARYGGEEFAIILINITLEKAREIADRLRSTVEARSFQLGDSPVSVTISVGVAMDAGSSDFNLIVKHADQAMYASKAKGKNCVSVWEEDLGRGKNS